MANQLNVTNFVQEIKRMDARARGKLRSEDLVNLIIQLPERPEESIQLGEISKLVTDIQNCVMTNTQEISKLKDENNVLRQEKEAMSSHIGSLVEDTNLLKEQIEGLEQYTRVNNIEIVGLDKEPPEEETVEEMVLACLNGMTDSERNEDEEVDEKFSAGDIDICHILPKKKNGEFSHVVRFVSRKAKLYAMDLKKAFVNRDYKFRDKTIYVNEHLTSHNKNLFSLAKDKKKALHYKHLWTRNGKIFMRKTDESEVIRIDSEEKISSLS